MVKLCIFARKNSIYLIMKYEKETRAGLVGMVLVGVPVVLAWLLGHREADVMFRWQEMSLWLPTRLFLEESLKYPGGLLTWAAAYMTQFFHSPALGAVLLCLAWLALSALLTAVGKLRGWWPLIVAVVPLLLAAALTQTGYWMFYQKLQGWPWVPTLGLLVAALLALPSRWTRGWWHTAWTAFVGLVGYPLLGAWWMAAMGLIVLTRRDGVSLKQHIVSAIMGLALIGLMPVLYYQWVYTQLMSTELFVAAMPTFNIGFINMGEFRTVYYLLALSLAPVALASWVEKYLRPRWVIALGIVLVALASWEVHAKWYRDTNFHKEAAMMTCIENLDWEGVLRVMRSHDMGEKMPPTRLMVMEKNLALFRLGRAGDEIFHYPEGSEQYCLCGRHAVVTKVGDRDTTLHLPLDKTFDHIVHPTRITQTGGKMLYYFYGKEQFSYRWSMEDGVEFGWNQNVLKYMVKTSLVSQDWEVARKYLAILSKTRYSKDWAAHYSQFLHRRDLMEKDPEFIPILPMAKFTNRLDGDMTLVEMYLLKTFSNGMGADVYYQEMTLICAMIMKDINLFWPRLRLYINMHSREPNFHLPTHYQEAAFLYSVLEPQRESIMWPGMTNAQAMAQLPFDESVKKRYADFMEFNKKCGSMTDEQKKVAFYPQFGDTFFYFYFLVRNQKTN